MELTRVDIATAAELTELCDEDIDIRDAYEYSFGASCPAVVLPYPATALQYTAALAVCLAEQGRSEEALNLGRHVCTDSMGNDIVVYWPGATLTDR